MDYTPAIHGYKYLLSPAKTWAEFGELEFTLCSAENPQKEVRTIRDYMPIEIIISFSIIGVMLLSGGIIVFVLVRKRQASR